MQIKRYMADDMRQALKQVREEQGPDAVILSSKQLANGLEVVAAVDYDESLIDQTLEKKRSALSSDPETSLSGPLPSRSDAPPSGSGAQSPGIGKTSRRRRGATGGGPSRLMGGDESLSAMREEIKALRRMLECQLSSLAWNDFSRQSPVRADLLRNLIHLGLPSPLAQDITARVPADERDPTRAWRHALSDFARMVPVDSDDALAKGGVITLVGPTGVGKTTAIARLAARSAQIHGSEHVAMIGTDTSRPGAQECLFSYGRLLNIPVYQADGADEALERLARLAHVRVVLVDTAGAVRDDLHFRQVSGLMGAKGRVMIHWLVLAANAQIQALEEAVMLYSNLPLTGIIATKLDETASLGGLLSVVAQSGLPLSLVSDSPKLSQPLRAASSRKLVKRAIALMRAAPRRMDKDSLAQHIGEMHYALG